MANKLTYIASGTSYGKVSYEEFSNDPELKEWIRSVLKKMNVDPIHTFGILYNAWTEKKFGKIFKENYEDCLEIIQADSGGLQVITQGLTITEDIRQAIYENQGTYSNMAMSFDEIPITISGSTSKRGDTTNRYFDRSKFEECARQSGRNLARQISKFLDMKTKTKPIMICQGNDYDSFMKWVEYLLQEVPQELQPYISGIAMGSPAIGKGSLEDIQKAFFYPNLPFKTPHLHLLGVGSVTRMLPNLIFMQNGVYNEVYMTYDSTTHMSGITYGSYYTKESYMYFPRHLNKKIHSVMFNDLQNEFGLDLSLEEMHEMLNTASKKYKEKHSSRILYIKVWFALILKSIMNFKAHVDRCIVSKDEIRKLTGSGSSSNAFMDLYNVKTKDDFDYWMRNCSKYVPSESVSDQPKATLKGLF